ncbi:hypothetical protein GPECTOR_12g491 [Gonium pectorale]|uniref:Uncharacterized protein n=1 Tax=Gonium pectorale TaxID=33097 RepID=A0A150GP62_GONPE|nr:hypothetical protein GPECTOR_12g491 [Gonium pectorale]|eukprot:KXZ51528.1 hypothetical protein GPECTOR_12g491 [Gonium pectorale]
MASTGCNVFDTDLGDAFCTLSKAANLLESTDSPGERQLEAKVDQLSADMVAVKADMVGVKADMATMMSMLVGIKAGQGNVAHRNMNGNSRMLEHTLEPLVVEAGENVGKYPEQAVPFPATLAVLTTLNNAQLHNLQQFYGCEFKGVSIAARQTAFAAFIGALSARS